jgi:LacI family transcriptional regulator
MLSEANSTSGLLATHCRLARQITLKLYQIGIDFESLECPACNGASCHRWRRRGMLVRMAQGKASIRRGSSLAEVARAAGVSIATASRVLNGGNKETWAGPAARARKIRQVAQKLGYRPHWSARALRTKQTNCIGVVYSQVNPMMDMTSYGRMFRAFGEVLEPAGYHLMFVHVPRASGAQPASILQAVDAAVFYHDITSGEVEAARILRGPSILINCEPKLPFTAVNPDETGGAKALTEHLLGLGHRRIAFVQNWRPGAYYDHYSREVRLNTMHQVMADDITTPYHEVVARFKSTPVAERPSALVMSYSIQAISLLNEFVKESVRVPEELSIATFDDHELVAQAIVPMTTVAVPMEEMGRTAAGLIFGLLQSPDRRTPKSIVLPEQLVIRRSTAAPLRLE